MKMFVQQITLKNTLFAICNTECNCLLELKNQSFIRL